MMLQEVPLRQRSVVLVTPDLDLRERIRTRLQYMRWEVLTASGGAEAMAHLGTFVPEAMIVDHWLPDLDPVEFVEHAASICPATEMLHIDGSPSPFNVRSPRRNELLHALREAQEEQSGTFSNPAISTTAAAGRCESLPEQALTQSSVPGVPSSPGRLHRPEQDVRNKTTAGHYEDGALELSTSGTGPASFDSYSPEAINIHMHLPDMVGDSAAMKELGRVVRLVAPHTATVLVQGETGTGKELVAKAVHRLSTRAGKPFVVLNCAAIPEHLLEAELFGHTRGAFTGAVASRTGRIEAAHGGTLFLDEIGEMPMALQAKMLRFLESGEVQRVGDNDISRVDVRIVAATHQNLLQNTDEKLFRLDLYHRLAVFPVDVAALRSRPEDIPMLVEHFLRNLAEHAPRKSIAQDALQVLYDYSWFGNVRELHHVVQRAVIMAGDSAVIATDHLRLRESARS
ncbi:MAG: sigma-54 dependent transcriptional regulator [Janthinobacterium lividum]